MEKLVTASYCVVAKIASWVLQCYNYRIGVWPKNSTPSSQTISSNFNKQTKQNTLLDTWEIATVVLAGPRVEVFSIVKSIIFQIVTV